MEAVLGRRELDREMSGLPETDRVLHIDLAGRDPDAGCTLVPYEKGALMLRTIERAVGRERFDTFLRGYFEHFAFQEHHHGGLSGVHPARTTEPGSAG